MKTIEKKSLRKKLLDACISKQQFLIDDFKERIKALTETQGLGNEESYDNSELAGNALKITEINTLNSLLEFANREMDLLENLKFTQDFERDKVSAGAIVVTNHNTFFVSASLENFFADGHPYIGISTSSPIFSAMEGKKKNESFSFMGIDYKIKDIF